ncbi:MULTISPECIES: cytochrome ubiquinol oxidase subunit I [Phytobacter]|uniref:Cytochrome ubiquinol oxidase subunit I n=1 Tax=Phytobacter diazotrophicus TaxID=395631 RepID=A0ABM7VX81_9ENTR|nr:MULTISPECIES: cytochrome ubiquinol oxidase subunit I [Phytobacter]MDU4150117.1 cytochrome ubiquinol oxidase subunit I [Enterobacteriaceae bacterium]MDU7376871.1 cytochrome ubiquinol oxidase subunit I [Enterobacteriaceae bacterium]BBE78160.1 cytochrome ubiquinol oxidase subunit I [Phytobacter sp. MRY16-398]BDD51532.1 cytochrome ubiquinol oxidase subunit I [Phytobacter diazotrophicus]BEG82561.1 cytochrome ubiquinol oxidase subunit I [Phytobacter diazotrophicus]
MSPETALLLARGQFAFTIGFHIVLAAFTLGLAQFLMVLEGLWLWRKQQVWLSLWRYWSKIFALNVAVGVVTGVVMEFSFGTNWSGLASRTGAVLGPMLYMEVLVAFFLEAGFMGVMLFGMGKVRPWVHFMATSIVALGSFFSAFWILAANSWMQTPDGFVIGAEGRFEPVDWWAAIINPSFPLRMAHMVAAAMLGTACLVAACGAWHLLRDARHPAARHMFSLAMWMLFVMAPLQIVLGDLHGENTRDHQPVKLAAIEGNWNPPPPGEGEPMRLFAIPDMAARRNHYEVAIPDVGSLYLRHNLQGTIHSLNQYPQDTLPWVPLVFWSFRVMVGLGLLMTFAGVAGLVVRLRRRLFHARWLLRLMVLMAPAGFVAMLAGWVVTEAGRQPWTVYGLLRTAESASPVSPSLVLGSLVCIVTVYLALFGLGLWFLLRILSRPPQRDEEGAMPDVARRTGQGGAE